MNLDTVISALNCQLRREILRITMNQPLTTKEVFEAIKKTCIKVRYRESIYRALEILSEADLLEKKYIKDKGLCYKTIHNKLFINLEEESVRG